MRRPAALLLVLLVSVPTGGCVVDWTGQSGSYLLREKLDITRTRTRDLQTDLQKERDRIDTMDQRAAEARRRYADSGASVQALMEDLTFVRGQLDSIQHAISRSGQLNEDMSFQLTAIDARLGHIEGQLIERVEGYEVAPVMMMPFEDEGAAAPDPDGAPEAEGDNDAGASASEEEVPEAQPAPADEPVAVVDPAVSDEERMFREGLTLTQQGEWKRAGGKLQEFTKEHPESHWWLEGQFLVGRCLYELGRYKAAIGEYQKVIVRDDKSAWAPRAMFMQGMAFESLGTRDDLDAAEVFYSELRRLYPKSDEATKAKVRLDALGR